MKGGINMNNIFDQVLAYANEFGDLPEEGNTNPMGIVYAYFLYCNKHQGDPAMEKVQADINVIPILEDSFIAQMPKYFQEYIEKYNEAHSLINIPEDMDISDEDIFLYACHKAHQSLVEYLIGWDEVAEYKLEYYADKGKLVAETLGDT